MQACEFEQKLRKQSFWLDSLDGPITAREPLQGERQADVVIVGAGYTGLWTAYYLLRHQPDIDLVILEAEAAGYGASGRNGGWCAGYITGIDGWISRPETREAGLRLQRLVCDTVATVGEVASEENIDCHFAHQGALEVATVPAQVRRLREELEHARSLGYGEELEHARSLGYGEDELRWLEAGEARDMIRIENTQAGLINRHCAAIHPARLARGLAEAVERRGATIHENSAVRAWQDKGDGNHLVHTDDGLVRARTVLLATEGFSDSIEQRRRRLAPLHSMMVATEPLNAEQLDSIGNPARFTFSSIDHIVTYAQRTADNRLAFGCRGGYWFNSAIQQFEPADPLFEPVRQTLLKLFPALSGVRFTHAWGGPMGVSRTLRPAVCYDQAAGHGYAGGYFGNGVCASNLAGRTLADLVLERDTERLATPWVNPPDAARRWEPEPLRWLGIHARKKLMQLTDWADYRESAMSGPLNSLLEHVK